jgi:hypothetical protein
VQERAVKRRVLASIAAIGAALAAGGCAIQFGADSPMQLNTCTGDSQCGDGALCRSNMCVGTGVDLTGLLLEVRPNSGATYGGSTSFLIPLAGAVPLQTAAGEAFDQRFNAKLPAQVKIASGKVHLGYASTCKLATDSSVPAKLTFDRATALAGFHFDSLKVEATAQPSGEYQFSASLLPGDYSVYIQPLPIPGCDEDPPPPVYYPKQKIQSLGGMGTDSLDWGVLKPTMLGGDIQIPDGGELAGWLLDIVEPEGGRVISTTQTLKQGMVAFSVNVSLQYIWLDTSSSPYIRLRPPEGQASPSVYWGLVESLTSLTKPEVHLSVENLKIDPRVVSVQVQDEGNAPVVAAVQIQSIELSGAVAKNAAYSIDVPATGAKDGSFTTPLPPGRYRIRATPVNRPELAVGETDLVVPALDANMPPDTCFCGHTLTVPRKGPLAGRVLTPAGQALVGAAISTDPSQSTALSYWSRVHALDPLLPRSESTLSATDGSFNFTADPGLSDLTVRPDDQSGFPWLVRPRVQMSASGVRLDDLRLSNPAFLRGVVTDPSGAPAGNVVVSGWLPVKNSDGTPAGTVIQIASTTTDARGTYTLVLPASLSQ